MIVKDCRGGVTPSICVASQSPLFFSGGGGGCIGSTKRRPREGPRCRSTLLHRHAASLYTQQALHQFPFGYGATTTMNPDLPLLAQQSSALPALASAAVTTTATTTGFWKLAAAFCLGGLFFSTVLAAVSACYAVGMQNVRTLYDIVRAIVVAVWSSFVLALQTAREALVMRPPTSAITEEKDTRKRASWQWRAAWQVLQQELGKTRQTAADGVMALRQEAALYAGAVGAPGLIPLQYSLDRFLPLFIANALQTSVQESLADIPRQTRSIRQVKLLSFSVGTTSPQLQAARVYDLGNQAAAYDVDVDWPAHELEIKLLVVTRGALARIPVVVRNVQFQGVVRIVLTPLTAEPPGFGAALVSFPKVPRFNLNVRVAGGDITRIPWLRSELVAAIQKGIANELLWPKRVVIPSTIPVWSATGGRVKEKPILSSTVLQQLERTDPLLERERALAESPLLRDQYQAPQLSKLRQQFKVFVNRPATAEGQEETANASSENNEEEAQFAKKTNAAPATIDAFPSVNKQHENTLTTTDTLWNHHGSSHNMNRADSDETSRRAKIQRGILWEALVARHKESNEAK